MKRKKLLVISHTEHYRQLDGTIVGWGPTVNEINYLAEFWEEVVHVGCIYEEEAPSSSLAYSKSNIKFSPIPAYGGKGLGSKILIITKIPKIIMTVLKNVKGASEVQLRLPTSIGIFLLPLFSFLIARKFIFWVKYAGNWEGVNQPISYRLQKSWLQKNYAKCAVTINGFWTNQPSHCYSFENPCLTEEDVLRGKENAMQKDFSEKYIFVFVGRLDDAKGVQRIIDALKAIPEEKIAMVHFVGDGPKKESYLQQLDFLKGKFKFHGFLGKEEVHKVLETAHFFLLPSASEGFPKALAEAACYGVIPIVSNVGSIAHYVNSENGFVWDFEGQEKYGIIMAKALQTEPAILKEMSNKAILVGEKFTFEKYREKLEKFVFKSN